MNYLLFLFCLFASQPTKSSGKRIIYLNPMQWADIRCCLLHPGTTCEQRTWIQRVIFDKYMDTSARQAYQFHRSIKKKVKFADMVHYAHTGLWLAIQKYNASMPFTKAYFSHYVFAYLMQGYAKCHPLTLVPLYKRIRRKSVSDLPLLYGMDSYLIEEKTRSQDSYTDVPESYSQSTRCSVSEILPPMTPFQKRVFFLKYSVKKKKRSNKEISEYMGCSEETVRTTLKKIMASASA